jgi:HYDIN/CFA65/VesB-like, Ig-like domain
VSVAGTGFSTGTLSLPISLASGNATTFNVQFAPTTAGNASGSVTIVSNAPNSPALVALTGTGVAATQTLTFSTTNLGFGNVNTGNSSTQSVTVTNSGNSSVSISKISESGSGFTLTGAGTPVTLSVGQSLTFGVVFSPSAAGSASGTVTVTSNAAGSPVTIALSGTGVQAATHSVTLNWTASTSSVSGYNVYRSTTNGSGYAKINSSLVGSSTYDDTTVQSGTTYYYVVTSVDSSGNESTDSNQATAVIP